MVARLPPLPALRAFAAIARLGSISATAKELHVTQSAVSHQLRALEDALGVSLLYRSGHKIHLTEVGRIYSYQIRQALDDMAAATRRIGTSSAVNTLRLSVLPSFAQHWLVPRLRKFIASCSDIQLSLSASMSFIDFDDDLFDCAIRFGHGDWPDVRTEKVMDDTLLLVCAPSFARGVPTTPNEALSAPLLHASESWSTWLSAAGIGQRRPTALMEFTDSTHMLEAARHGMGIALTRRSIAHASITRGDLVRVTSIEPLHPSSYFLVWPRKNNKLPQLQRMAEWLRIEISLYKEELKSVGKVTPSASCHL